MIEASHTPIASQTILLLGGTGFLGTNLAIWLRNAGHRALVIGRAAHGLDGRSAVALSLGDIEATCELVRAEKVDMVVHMASGLLPASGEADYLGEKLEIHQPLFRLARELAAMGVGLSFLSSGGTVYGSSPKPSVAEDDPCLPISLYGQAKLEAELHLRFLARTCGLRLLILRPSNPYGMYQSLHGTQGLVSVILGRIANDRPLDIWGDGSSVRDYVFVEDAVQCMGELIVRNQQGTYNIGSGIGSSLIDVVRTAEEVTGKRVTLQFHPARPADVPRLVLDVSRLAELGLHHARPLDMGMRHYVEQLGMTRGG